MRAARALVVIAIGLLCTRGALAESKVVPTRLHYSAPKSCPDEHDFHTMTAGNLPDGQDPYTDTADQTLDVKVTRERGSYIVDFVLVDAEGKPKKPYGASLDRLKARGETCRAMVEAAALVVLTAVRMEAPEPEATAAPAPATSPAPAPPPAPKPPEPPSRSEIPPDDLPHPAPPPNTTPTPKDLRFGAYGWGEYATLLKPDFGVTASVGGRIGPFSAALQVRWDLVVSAGGYSVGAVSEGVALCGHVKKYFVPCGLAEVSEVQILGTWVMGRGVSLARGAIGARLSWEFPLRSSSPRLILAPALDALGAFGLTRGYPVPIKLSPVNVRLGAGLLVEFGSP